MDDDTLLTIGAFARAAGLSPSALRHYDDVGLLAPAHTDATTGYRFYDAEQMERARLVARLRGCGVGIGAMQSLVALAPRERAARLEAMAAEVEHAAAERAASLRALADEAPVAQCAEARLPGSVLAAALRRVGTAAGQDGHDVVVVDLGEGTLTLLATNRYVLARRILPVADAVGASRVLVPLGGALALAGALDAAGPVRVTVSPERLDVAGHPSLAARTDLPHPDLHAVVAGHSPAPRHVVVRRRGELTDRPVIDAGEVALPVTPALMATALKGLVGERVVLSAEAVDRPFLLTSVDQPEHVVLVMPRRRR